jgi:hypothetical protein
MRSPRLRAVLAAVHWGRCTRFALPHASSITRESPGEVARILPMSESKVLRRPAANYASMLRSCNGSRQHFRNCCVHATSTEAQLRDSQVWMPRYASTGFEERAVAGLCVAVPTAIEQPARRAPFNGAVAARGATSVPRLAMSRPLRFLRPFERGVARRDCSNRAGLAFRVANSV